MTLVFREEAHRLGNPGLHAFIAGVSSYRYLPGGGGPLAKETYELRQLSSAALSACKVYHWLLDHNEQLPVPLATVRLLLSPSDAELASEEVENLVGGQGVERCTRKRFAAGIQEWHEDANSGRDGFTFFYFAGHGIERMGRDAVMLLDDFGEPGEGRLANCAELNNIRDGMAPIPKETDEIARQQLYIIDTCRVVPDKKDLEHPSISTILDVKRSGVDDRTVPIFFAAIPGKLAYGRRGEQSLFSEALLDCLNGQGAEPLRKHEVQEGQAQWGVNIFSLTVGLEHWKNKLNKDSGGEVVTYALDGSQIKNVLLNRLSSPPKVDFLLRLLDLKPDELSLVRLEVVDSKEAEVWNLKPVNPHPYESKLPAGLYRVKASIVDPAWPPDVVYQEWLPFEPLNNSSPVEVRLV